MYLLDTNVVSALRRLERECAELCAWAERSRPHDAYLSAITILEIEHGVLQKERRDTAQGAILRTWLEETILPSYSGRILALDETVARRCAGLHVPNPCAYRDSMIAATALCHDLTLVTRNTADFGATGVRLLNPWLA